MFLGPLLHRDDVFELPYAGGCNLGTRTVEPHMAALRPFGLEVKATDGSYHAQVNRGDRARPRPIVLTERGDTVTENALMAAALHPGTTVIRNASSNYMVQDLCFFLQQLGVGVEGIGTTTLTVHGLRARSTSTSTTRPPRTRSRRCRCWRPRSSPSPSITIQRVPIEFLEIELALLEEMGFQLHPLRGVRRRATGTPGWSTSPPSRSSCTPPSTRSTRCRSPASTSTTCRSSR